MKKITIFCLLFLSSFCSTMSFFNQFFHTPKQRCPIKTKIEAALTDGNHVNDNQIPLLLDVTDNSHLSLLEKLLNSKADPNSTLPFMFNETALHRVCSLLWGPNIQGAQLLLMHGADPNRQTSGLKLTPLMEATSNGFSDLVNTLLTNKFNKANPNLQDINGQTALVLALKHLFNAPSSKKQNFLKIVEILLENNADPTIPDNLGNTGLSLIKQLKDSETNQYRFLKEYEN